MAFCARCGHDLGEAPVCDRCGTRAARYAQPGAAGHTSPRLPAVGLDDTAERPGLGLAEARHARVVAEAEPTVVPPPSAEPAFSHARFPLFADEAVPVRTAEEPAVAPPPVAGRDRSMAELLPWVFLAVAAVGLLLVTAVWLLFRPGSDATATERQQTAASADGRAGDRASDQAEDGATQDQPTEGESATGTDRGDDAPAGRTRNVAAGATALVPSSAPAGQDVRGRPVRYTAAQMFDGDRSTAWRMVGDGTDALITIRLARPTEVSKIGLVNGYAKQDVDGRGHTVRWYPRNRRITAVTWSFDDGSVVEQDLRQRPDMQMTKVGSEVTRTIRLRLVGVTPPMPGPRGRNYTAISEIRIKGVPAG
ncbi:hypothetical protein [Nocardioides sp.]|uniref:NADase-type glycan-binding domain-containing protein n=1 Tax=Nocardioides sp. TaxID=35761 RepID=UPI00352785E8